MKNNVSFQNHVKFIIPVAFEQLIMHLLIDIRGSQRAEPILKWEGSVA